MAATLACDARFPANGHTIEIAPDVTGSPGTYAFVGATIDATPPPQVRATVDLTALEDDASCSQPGIEEPSEFTFNEWWDPIGETSVLVDGYYDSGEQVWIRLSPTNGTNRRAITFSGRVLSLTPATAGGDGGYSREVTILKNSVLTYADQPIGP